MDAMDAQPEQLVAEMNRRRQQKMFGALGALLLGLGALFAAALAMYADDPAELAPTTLPPQALQPAPR